MKLSPNYHLLQLLSHSSPGYSEKQHPLGEKEMYEDISQVSRVGREGGGSS